MTHGFLIPAAQVSEEIEVRKSRFICHLAHADNAQQAKQFIATIKDRYTDATHNCWAFQTEEPGSTRSIGCSDDGEPHGSAGKPMLNILSHSEVGEVVAVVTRYYGGTKLGTGGLVRAYSDSVKAALDKLVTCIKVDWQYGSLTIGYNLQSAVEKTLIDSGVEITNSKFAEKVTLMLRYGAESLAEINEKLGNLSQGALKIQNPEED
ncbi:MAG: YigZ family protein [Gammaproteobacteria bacterium]|nr:YigZ family protein [Gammaproteobacteria bacterium]